MTRDVSETVRVRHDDINTLLQHCDMIWYSVMLSDDTLDHQRSVLCSVAAWLEADSNCLACSCSLASRFMRLVHLFFATCKPINWKHQAWPHLAQVYKPEDVSGEIIIEMDVTWAGQQNVQLIIKPFPKFHVGVGIGIGKLISNFLTMRVGVGDLFFSGRVRLSLKPLVGRLPVVGAVRVSFVEQPHFNYALTVYGGDISFLPGQCAQCALVQY